jgi:alkylglycerol monooxygenase
MYFHVVAIIIPLLFAFIGFEYVMAKKAKKNYFSFSTSISNISVGVAERIAQLFFAGYFIYIYQCIYDNFSVFRFTPGVVSWILLFFLTDLLWYWNHRLSHQVSIVWGAHVVHHQSEEYNLTVALRVTIFQAFVRLLFGALLPLFGFPVYMIVIMISLLGLYQFFLHTRIINRLGWLEYILVTPSHHRVHHGNNTIYIDKNYGGILILWDKLFGTFQSETEEVTYGLTKQLNSNSFLWLHFHFWLDLLENIKNTRGIRNKIKVVFSNPAKLKYDFNEKLARYYLTRRIANKSLTKDSYPVLYTYIKIQVLLSVASVFLIYFIDLPFAVKSLLSLTISITLINCGAILEQKRWVFLTEIIRAFFIYILAVLVSGKTIMYNFFPVLFIAFTANYSFLEKKYLRFFYPTT